MHGLQVGRMLYFVVDQNWNEFGVWDVVSRFPDDDDDDDDDGGEQQQQQQERDQ